MHEMSTIVIADPCVCQFACLAGGCAKTAEPFDFLSCMESHGNQETPCLTAMTGITIPRPHKFDAAFAKLLWPHVSHLFLQVPGLVFVFVVILSSTPDLKLGYSLKDFSSAALFPRPYWHA